MKWDKKGLIFHASEFDWSSHSALQPTPLQMHDRLRVFVGTRCEKGMSRIAFVDLDLNDPTLVLGVSEGPILDVGAIGCFDEAGVVPSAVLYKGSTIYLFYAGYQLGINYRFSVLGGLAVSDDNGQSFRRIMKNPIFERNDSELLFRVPHSVLLDDNTWKIWYGAGSTFEKQHNKTVPLYDIRYLETDKIENFSRAGSTVLKTENAEYRLGRPYIFSKNADEHFLFYGYSTHDIPYQLGFAKSTDMINWQRCDHDIGLNDSPMEWEKQMRAYPAVIQINGRVMMLYNGNEYGREGFGLAELEAW